MAQTEDRKSTKSVTDLHNLQFVFGKTFFYQFKAELGCQTFLNSDQIYVPKHHPAVDMNV